MSSIDRDADMIFMNYGWASLEAGPQPLVLRLKMKSTATAFSSTTAWPRR
jgi:hypothetical protein